MQSGAICLEMRIYTQISTHTRYEKIHQIFLTSPPYCLLCDSAIQTKCWQSLLNFGLTLLHGLSDGLSTPRPLHCPYSDEIWPHLCLCCTVTPLSPHRLKRRHSNFLSVSHLRIFYDFSCALVLHWPPKISYSASNKGRRSPWRDIAQLSIPLPCQRLSLLSIYSSLKCNICHFLCGKKLMQHHNP